MKKIKTALENIHQTINDFYVEDEWILTTMNGVDLEDAVEAQWIFTHYFGEKETTIISCICGFDTILPSITDIIPGAWLAEGEFYDLFDIPIKGVVKGAFLENDHNLPIRSRS
jgi:NADH:ubiquinone oxidoreductase subunit C